jgi:sugar diacid utilization regulator
MVPKTQKKPSSPKQTRRAPAGGPKKKASARSKPAQTSEDTRATLASLSETLGAGMIQILTAPQGLEVKLSEPVIHDPNESANLQEGDVVLAVGVNVNGSEMDEFIRGVGESNAAAVAVKSTEGTDRLRTVAEEAGVALLVVPAEMTWSQLFSLLRTAIVSSGTVPDRADVGTPIGDLFALANAVAAMVGGPATIENPQSRVLAYSSLDEPIDEPRRQTILGRRVPETWLKRLHERGIFKELWSSEDPIEIDLPYKGLSPRLAIAVRAGGEILGSLWVQEGNKPLGPQAKEALTEAAQIAALHLIRHRASEDLKRRLHGELLRSVVDGRAVVDQVAARLGFDAASAFTVVIFELMDLDEADGLRIERTRDVISLYLESFHRRALCTPIGNSILGLVPSQKGQADTRLDGLCRRIIDQAASSLGVRLRAGIGSTVSPIAEVPKSREEAERVLQVLTNRATDQDLASIDEVRADSILVELREIANERPELNMGRLKILRAHDADHNTEYLKTLRAYFDAFGEITSAAQAVNVHANTFRYRLRRLTEISGIDLADPSERLVTELQLRLL